MFTYPSGVGTSLAAAQSKIVSPSLEQDMKSRGVAQVIAILNPSPGASLALHDSQAAKRVEGCFRSSELSQASALSLSFSGSGAKAAAAPAVRPSITFPNLGVVLGTVDYEGLAGLQASPDVAAICGSPQFSLIRPHAAAAVPAPKGITWGIERLGVPALWKQGLSGAEIAVAHLDTGVDATHPALRKAVADFAMFDLTLGQRIAPGPAPSDSGDHGTHTAGTIAGRPVAGRHIGVAPGALLHSGMVIEAGNVVARVLGGLDWAIASNVKIISMSLGFRGWWEDFIPIVQIIRSRGILPVIAVGNEGPGTSRSPGNYPAVLSVGAEDSMPSVAAFSSSQTFARTSDPLVPDLVAPGVDVISAAPQNRYQSMSGSSMATPHVAGLAALLWEAKPSATADDIERAICESCRLSPSLARDRANRGEPDARDAYARLTGNALPAAATMVAVGAPVKPERKRSARTKPAVRGKRTAKTAKKSGPTRAASAKKVPAGARRAGKKKAGAKRARTR
ncbi:MAG: S8 family serine peptidase [Vicinamibacterales bacterium]